MYMPGSTEESAVHSKIGTRFKVGFKRYNFREDFAVHLGVGVNQQLLVYCKFVQIISVRNFHLYIVIKTFRLLLQVSFSNRPHFCVNIPPPPGRDTKYTTAASPPS